MTVIDYFKKLCTIPHGSGNEKAISDYILNFAKENNLKARQDSIYNVAVFKEASPGRENEDPVIIQSHIDMVCVKKDTCTKDLSTEGIDVIDDGEWFYADGTSLGADDAAGVAMMLKILSDKTLSHPPLECIFTTHEEDGFDGVKLFDVSDIKGKRFINLDGGNDSIIVVSCAGAAHINYTLPLKALEVPSEYIPYQVTISGLLGGHSGVAIHKGRAMSHVLMTKALLGLDVLPTYMTGGEFENVIPSYTKAIFWAEASRKEELKNYFAKLEKQFQDEYPKDSACKIELEALESCEHKTDIKDALLMLSKIPTGIQSYVADCPKAPQTSINLSIVDTNENSFTCCLGIRSSVRAERDSYEKQIADLTKSFGASAKPVNSYPEWQYKKESTFRDKAIDVYKECFDGKEPRIIFTHAGLECGFFAEKIKDLDCISIGPTEENVHSVNERLNIASVDKSYNYLIKLIQEV